MRLLDLLLRWHARRLFQRLACQPGAVARQSPVEAPADNVYPLW